MSYKPGGHDMGAEKKAPTFPTLKLILIVGLGLLLLITGISAFGVALLQPFIGIVISSVLLAASMGVPYMLFRRSFGGASVKDQCPHCGAWIRVRGYMAQTSCPRCE